MPYTNDAAIGLVEAAYDFHTKKDGWLSRVIDAAGALLDDGFGVMGVLGRQASPGTVPEVEEIGGPRELLAVQLKMLVDTPKAAVERDTRTGVLTVSEQNVQRPEQLAIFNRHLGKLGARDAIGVTGVDTNGLGIHLFAPTKAPATLGATERVRWRMLTAHLSAGQRLRKRLRDGTASGDERNGLPRGAEAVINPKSFKVEEVASAQIGDRFGNTLREAAMRVDRERAKQGRVEPARLESWEALLCGRWSMLDWFDTDQRRYVLAVPNPPGVKDPRGLTKRESQVAAYAAIGENHKLIAYRLGISRVRVTNHLSAAMRKLGVKTQAQLVERMRGLRS